MILSRFNNTIHIRCLAKCLEWRMVSESLRYPHHCVLTYLIELSRPDEKTVEILSTVYRYYNYKCAHKYIH